MTNLLYTLDVSPEIDAIGIKEISEYTLKNSILNKIRELIKSGKNCIPINQSRLNHYCEILSEIKYVSSGTLLKHDKIIFPEILFEKAIKLAASAVHPGPNGLIRRMRNHFFVKHLTVAEYVNSCSYCQMFTNKVYRHPVKPNKVPKRCWEENFVDLFGPLPSNNHIAVIQGLAFRYPILKLVKWINAKSVITALEDVCDTLGNPHGQRTPFNSKEMENVTKNRNIKQVKTLPGHPSHNNVETVMKPFGKAMKIG